MIRMLELVHCVEAGFGEGVKNKRRKKKKGEKTYLSKAGTVTQR